MVDVSPKEDSKRVAIASCRVLLGQRVFNLVSSNEIAKGDVLTVAKIAGITGAKQTSNLIPLCHNINLSHVRVDLSLNEEDSSVVIEGEATTSGKTGVEMEAMTAVAIAGLTVYDMCKAQSRFKGHLYNRYLSGAQIWGKEWKLVQKLKGSLLV